jgi:hypothetical protein
MDLPNVAELACVRCGKTTTHDRVDGRMQCIRCRVLDGVARKAVRAESGSRMLHGLASLLLLVAVVAVTGLVHFVHGGNVGCTVVQKEEWGFYDQVVDMDDIVGMPLFSQLGRARTIRALVEAGILARPELGD